MFFDRASLLPAKQHWCHLLSALAKNILSFESIGKIDCLEMADSSSPGQARNPDKIVG